MAKITVLGAGGWGIALAVLLHNNGHEVTIWSAVEREVNEINETRENKVSLPGIVIPEKIKVSGDLDESVKDRDVLVMAVASKFTRSTAARLKGKVSKEQKIVNVAKGIEEDTLMTLTDVIEDEIGKESDYILVSQVAGAKKTVFSKTQLYSEQELKNTIEHINRAMKINRCDKRIEYGSDAYLAKNWEELDNRDFEDIMNFI